jgi:hypothetical protein
MTPGEIRAIPSLHENATSDMIKAYALVEIAAQLSEFNALVERILDEQLGLDDDEDLDEDEEG